MDKMNQIFALYSNLMYYVAFQVLHHAEDAEDAVLEAFFKIYQNLDKISEVDCPKTKRFVVIVTERQAIDLYRKRKREQTLPMETLGECNAPAGSDYAERNAVVSAITALPDDYREAILLRYATGYTVLEIAEILGFSVSKVEKLLSRGKKKLRKLLREEGIDYE